MGVTLAMAQDPWLGVVTVFAVVRVQPTWRRATGPWWEVLSAALAWGLCGVPLVAPVAPVPFFLVTALAATVLGLIVAWPGFALCGALDQMDEWLTRSRGASSLPPLWCALAGVVCVVAGIHHAPLRWLHGLGAAPLLWLGLGGATWGLTGAMGWIAGLCATALAFVCPVLVVWLIAEGGAAMGQALRGDRGLDPAFIVARTAGAWVALAASLHAFGAVFGGTTVGLR